MEEVQSERLFVLQIPTNLSQEQLAELTQALERIEGLQVIQEEERGLETFIPDTFNLVVVAVALGVVDRGLDGVKHPVKYLRNNAAKVKEIASDLNAIIKEWFGNGSETTAKEKITFSPATQEANKSKPKKKPAKKFKDVTEDDLEDAITEPTQKD